MTPEILLVGNSIVRQFQDFDHHARFVGSCSSYICWPGRNLDYIRNHIEDYITKECGHIYIFALETTAWALRRQIPVENRKDLEDICFHEEVKQKVKFELSQSTSKLKRIKPNFKNESADTKIICVVKNNTEGIKPLNGAKNDTKVFLQPIRRDKNLIRYNEQNGGTESVTNGVQSSSLDIKNKTKVLLSNSDAKIGLQRIIKTAKRKGKQQQRSDAPPQEPQPSTSNSAKRRLSQPQWNDLRFELQRQGHQVNSPSTNIRPLFNHPPRAQPLVLSQQSGVNNNNFNAETRDAPNTHYHNTYFRSNEQNADQRSPNYILEGLMSNYVSLGSRVGGNFPTAQPPSWLQFQSPNIYHLNRFGNNFQNRDNVQPPNYNYNN